MVTLNRILQCGPHRKLDSLHSLPTWMGDAWCKGIFNSRHGHLNAFNRLSNHNRRFLNTQNNTVKPTSNTPKQSNIPLDQPSTILQEKAQNAARLHAELNTLLEAQAERQVKESSKPFGSSLKNFFNRNRKEFLNIFAAFMCVLLAWQITTMRRGARKLIDISEEKDQVIKDLRSILRQLHGPDEAFIEKIVQQLIHEMKTNDDAVIKESLSSSATEKRSSYYNGLLHIFHVSRNSILKEEDEERVKHLLRFILRQELDKIIGTAAMSNDEIAQKKMSELQKEMGLVQAKAPQADRDLVNLLDSINRDGDVSGDVLKKSKGFI